MKIEMGKQYGTRGNPTVAVRLRKILESQCLYRVCGAVRNNEGAFWDMTWTIEGRIWATSTTNSRDLVPLVVDEPEVAPREIYVNESESGMLSDYHYNSGGHGSPYRVKFVEVVEEVGPKPKPLSGTVIRWMNVYEGGGISAHHKTRKQADQVAGTNRLACVKITAPWVEGQFDE